MGRPVQSTTVITVDIMALSLPVDTSYARWMTMVFPVRKLI